MDDVGKKGGGKEEKTEGSSGKRKGSQGSAMVEGHGVNGECRPLT